jgi:hypothetical protein
MTRGGARTVQNYLEMDYGTICHAITVYDIYARKRKVNSLILSKFPPIIFHSIKMETILIIYTI